MLRRLRTEGPIGVPPVVDRGKISHIDQQVKPEGYGQTVAAQLKDLGVAAKK